MLRALWITLLYNKTQSHKTNLNTEQSQQCQCSPCCSYLKSVMVLSRLVISYKDVHNMLLKSDDSSNSLCIVVMGKENNSLLPLLCSFILSGLWTFSWKEVTGVFMQTRPSCIKVSNMKLLQWPVVVQRVLRIFRNCWPASHCWPVCVAEWTYLMLLFVLNYMRPEMYHTIIG